MSVRFRFWSLLDKLLSALSQGGSALLTYDFLEADQTL